MKNKHSFLEEGFTLTETVIAVFVLSLGSYLLFLGGHRLYKGFNDLKNRNIFISEAAQCSNLLKSDLNDIRFPYWEHSLSIDSDSDELMIPYLHGRKDSVLTIAFTDNGFSISTGEGNFIIFESLKNGSIDPISKEDTTVGLSIVFLDEKDNEYDCKFLFGSIPLIEKDNYEN